jgi:hypothetical protein
MLEELNAEINNYLFHWKQLAASRHNRGFFDTLLPTALGWKTADPAEFDKRFAVLRAHSTQVHLGWVNKRWIATFLLREPLGYHDGQTDAAPARLQRPYRAGSHRLYGA